MGLSQFGRLSPKEAALLIVGVRMHDHCQPLDPDVTAVRPGLAHPQAPAISRWT